MMQSSIVQESEDFLKKKYKEFWLQQSRLKTTIKGKWQVKNIEQKYIKSLKLVIKRYKTRTKIFQKKPSMYHKFIPLASTEHQMNTKLHYIIDYYTTTQPTLTILGLPPVISIKFSLYNQRHKSQFIVLSNQRVVRYDYSQDEIYVLEGLQDVQIVQVKVLETGRDEKYLLLTDDGVVVCTVQTVEGERFIEGKMKVDEQNMMEAQQVVQIEKNKDNKFPKSLSCQLYGKLLLQMTQMSQQTNQNIVMQKNMVAQHELEMRNFYIVMGGRTQTHSNAFIVIISKLFSKVNYNIRIYKLTTILQKQHNHQQKILQLMKLPNSLYQMQISLCGIKVPFDITEQQQQLNPVQVTESNAKYIKSHPIVTMDRQVDQHNGFSLYIATQAITKEMEENEFRHTVFQFQFFACNEQSLVSVNCPVYEYPQRKVICPLRVYHLPLVDQSSILRHVAVTKTFSSPQINTQSFNSPQIMEETKKTLPKSISKKLTFTTVSMHSQGKIVFESIQCNVTQQQHNQKFSYSLNQQNVLFSTVVDEKIVLREVLLLDGNKRFAILLVNDGAIKINQEFLVGKKSTKESQNQQKQTNPLKIVFLDLRPPLSQNQSRIVSQQTLHPSYNDTISSLSLHFPNNITNNTSPIKSTHLLPQSFLHQKKTIHLSNSRTKAQQIECILNLVPKNQIYQQMLFDLLGQKGKEEKFQLEYKSLNHEIFYSSIIRTLSI